MMLEIQEPIVESADQSLQSVAKEVDALPSQNSLRVHDPGVVPWSVRLAYSQCLCSVI